jgi:TfoX/Sxy family transcriptional regulator of competence genes
MAFDESLAERVRKQRSRQADLTEKKMFAGVAFLINGNMSVALHGSELIVRVVPGAAADALKESGSRPFDITGRPMKGRLLVGDPGVKEAATLTKWMRRGVEYVAALPKKQQIRAYVGPAPAVSMTVLQTELVCRSIQAAYGRWVNSSYFARKGGHT